MIIITDLHECYFCGSVNVKLEDSGGFEDQYVCVQCCDCGACGPIVRYGNHRCGGIWVHIKGTINDAKSIAAELWNRVATITEE